MSVVFSPAGTAELARLGGDRGDIERDLATLRELGWLTACLPRDKGGEGWASDPGGQRALMAALRQLGEAELSLARLFEGHANAVKLIALYADTPARDRAFAALRKGTFMGVWGADRPGDPLRAEREGDGFAFSGGKRFCSGLGLVDQAIVTADLDGEQRLFLLPVDQTERQDTSAWDMDAMEATRSGEYDFGGLDADPHALIGEAGDFTREPFFEGGIWRYCAGQLGAGERLYDLMLEELVGRRRTGDPHQKDRIAKAAMAIETARLWIARAADAVESADADSATVTLSLLAREVTERSLKEVMGIVEAALGMSVHARSHPARRVMRDLSLYLCQAAPDAKRQKAAEMLVESQKRPAEL